MKIVHTNDICSLQITCTNKNVDDDDGDDDDDDEDANIFFNFYGVGIVGFAPLLSCLFLYSFVRYICCYCCCSLFYVNVLLRVNNLFTKQDLNKIFIIYNFIFPPFFEVSWKIIIICELHLNKRFQVSRAMLRAVWRAEHLRLQ